MTIADKHDARAWQPWLVGACCLAVVPGVAQALYAPLGIVVFFLAQDSIAPAEKADALAAMIDGVGVATGAHMIAVILSGFAFGALAKSGGRALANVLYATPAALIVAYVSMPSIAGAALAFLVSILAGLGAVILGNYFSTRTKAPPTSKAVTAPPPLKSKWLRPRHVRHKNVCSALEVSVTDKYADFIAFLFDRQEADGDWHYSSQADRPDLDHQEVVAFTARMLNNYRADLAHYSDWQLARGLEYVFYVPCSDYVFSLTSSDVDPGKRADAVLALKTLFRDCLNERCQRVTGIPSAREGALDTFCYMLWDASPVSRSGTSAEVRVMAAAAADVMKFSLYLDNVACVQSGLHGLGHLRLYYEEASDIVAEFIASGRCTDSGLLAYAENAQIGRVQ